MKLEDYSITDVKNAFKLLAKEDDKFIPLDTIKEILEENDLSEMDIIFLTNQLAPYTDTKKQVNYQEFLKSLSI